MRSGKITILMPVFNMERYLRDALDCLLKQTYTNWECICVNDGSTDESGTILAEYAKRDKRFRVLSQSNMGLTKTHNKQLDLVQNTDYLFFRDADDYCHPQTFEILLNLIQKYDADVAECGHLNVYEEDPQSHYKSIEWEKCPIFVFNDMSIFLTKKTRRGAWLPVWNKLYRWDKIKDIRFSEKLSYEDDNFYSSVVNANIGKKVIIDCPLCFYRQNPASMTHTLNFARYVAAGTARIQESYDYFIVGNRVPPTYMADFYADLANDGFRMMIRKSLKKCPDPKLRRELFFKSADAMNRYVADGVIRPQFLNMPRRFVLWLCRKKCYALARVFVFLTN